MVSFYEIYSKCRDYLDVYLKPDYCLDLLYKDTFFLREETYMINDLISHLKLKVKKSVKSQATLKKELAEKKKAFSALEKEVKRIEKSLAESSK